MWILTYEVNEYDQYGEYFKDAWPEKPTREQIEKILQNEKMNYTDILIDHILDGGGRQDVEYEWFYLFEHHSKV